jgi:hypothetical protein
MHCTGVRGKGSWAGVVHGDERSIWIFGLDNVLIEYRLLIVDLKLTGLLGSHLALNGAGG